MSLLTAPVGSLDTGHQLTEHASPEKIDSSESKENITDDMSTKEYKKTLAELPEIGSQEDFNKFANPDLVNELEEVLPTPEATATESGLGGVAVSPVVDNPENHAA